MRHSKPIHPTGQRFSWFLFLSGLKCLASFGFLTSQVLRHSFPNFGSGPSFFFCSRPLVSTAVRSETFRSFRQRFCSRIVKRISDDIPFLRFHPGDDLLVPHLSFKARPLVLQTGDWSFVFLLLIFLRSAAYLSQVNSVFYI